MKLALFAFTALAALAQVNSLSKEQLTQYTKLNPFDRFPDGRPKVPDALLEKLRAMSSEEILSIVRKGYPNQYVDGFQIVNPSKNLVGRAMTLQLMPSRPDVADVDQEKWKATHNGARLSHQSAIDMLTQNGSVNDRNTSCGSLPGEMPFARQTSNSGAFSHSKITSEK